MNWSDILASALPTIALIGGGLLKTHSTIKKTLVTAETVLEAILSSQSEK